MLYLVAVFFAVLAWRYVAFVADMHRSGDVSAVLRWPQWPWWAAVGACIALTAVVAAIPARAGADGSAGR